jgi:hypothetical protein
VVARALEEHLQVQLLWYELSASVFALPPARRSVEFTGCADVSHRLCVPGQGNGRWRVSTTVDLRPKETGIGMTTTAFNAKEPLCHGRRVARPTGRPAPRPRVSLPWPARDWIQQHAYGL